MYTHTVQINRRREINTDPQRRCYYGVHAKSEIVLTGWEDFCLAKSEEDAKDKIDWWEDLDRYAAKSQGKTAIAEYRIIPWKPEHFLNGR